ncbi:flavin reductase family protein [Dictyobacter formicarum]|uniref:Monooxygenase n=1 Tax=Dictyobacter formicarum TaxID=2778368 RepID=A0ABQ3VS46_9CHLR|nr:flavin reductase family protein [Dictyobacter formicarum]GHO89099.1 monooxygenase [Dictyobacter formicarum]
MAINDYAKSIEVYPLAAPFFLAPTIDSTDYQHIMGYFATGVAVITTLHHSQPIGFTAHTFSAISRDPALISCCAGDGATIWPLIEAASTFCVNILSEKQQNISHIFSRAGGVRFQTTEYSRATSGTPILPGGLAWIECSVAALYPAGDQLIVLGRVHQMETLQEGKPLVAYRGQFGTFEMPSD